MLLQAAECTVRGEGLPVAALAVHHVDEVVCGDQQFVRHVGICGLRWLCPPILSTLAHSHAAQKGYVLHCNLVMRDDPLRHSHRVTPWLASASPPQVS